MLVLGTTERKTWKAAFRRAFLPRSLSLRLIWRVVLTPPDRDLVSAFQSCFVFDHFWSIETVSTAPVRNLVSVSSIPVVIDLVFDFLTPACLRTFLETEGIFLAWFGLCGWSILDSCALISNIIPKYLEGKEKNVRIIRKKITIIFHRSALLHIALKDNIVLWLNSRVKVHII